MADTVVDIEWIRNDGSDSVQVTFSDGEKETYATFDELFEDLYQADELSPKNTVQLYFKSIREDIHA